MGTRHLTIVKVDGIVKVAQYGQWDGYPAGQGMTIAKFLQDQMDVRTFKKELRALTFISPKEAKARWVEVGADPNSDLVSFDIADKHRAKWPGLSRDTGAGILKLIQDGKVDKVQNDHSFLKDTTFCEFAYEIDMDKKVVTVMRPGRGPDFKIKFADFTAKRMKALEKEMWPDDEE